MFNIVALLSLVSFSAFASVKNIQAVQIDKMSEKQGVALLRHHLSESLYVAQDSAFAFEEDKNYSNGDIVILWGVGSTTSDQTITEEEYKGLWRVMNYLSGKDFRVVMNVRSTAEDLRDAFSSRTSSVVIWSAHGNKNFFYDYNSKPIPTDIFESRASNVYQFVLSTCYGSQALRNSYVVPQDLKVYSWEGLTNATELTNFLVSDNWSALQGKQ